VCLCIFLLKATKLILLKSDTSNTIQYNTKHETDSTYTSVQYTSYTATVLRSPSQLQVFFVIWLTDLLIIAFRSDKHVYIRRYIERQGNDSYGYLTYSNITPQTVATKEWRYIGV
jgi:hypothetical protein